MVILCWLVSFPSNEERPWSLLCFMRKRGSVLYPYLPPVRACCHQPATLRPARQLDVPGISRGSQAIIFQSSISSSMRWRPLSLSLSLSLARSRLLHVHFLKKKGQRKEELSSLPSPQLGLGQFIGKASVRMEGREKGKWFVRDLDCRVKVGGGGSCLQRWKTSLRANRWTFFCAAAIVQWHQTQ